MKKGYLILFLILFLINNNFSWAKQNNINLENNRVIDEFIETNINQNSFSQNDFLNYCNPPPAVDLSYRREINKAYITFKTPNVINLSHFVARISLNPYLGSGFDHWGELIPNLPLPIAGATQTIEINFLDPKKKYYFGMKIFNNCGGQSYLMILTLEPALEPVYCSSPDPISDITVKRDILKSLITFKTPNHVNLSHFVIRISDVNYQGSNFDNWGNLVNHNIIPNPNTYQTLELNNIDPYKTYYVGIKLFNNCGGQSYLSIITLPAIISNGCLPLFQIKDLSVVALSNSVILKWENPKHTSTSKYFIEIRKSLNPINDSNFNQAELIINNLIPTSGVQSFVVSNLNSDTVYYFGLIVKNNCDQKTDVNTISVKTLTIFTGGGGGGGIGSGSMNVNDDEAQSVKKSFILINNNEEITYSRNVVLNLYAENAKEMLISNYSDFRDAYWLSYKNTLNWFLTEDFGQKFVYAKFRFNNNIVSEVVSDSIFYLPFYETIPQSSFFESKESKESKELKKDNSILTNNKNFSIVKKTNFNQLMVNWLSSNFKNLLNHDLNNDKKIDYKDVKILFSNWQNLEIKLLKKNLTNLDLNPRSKIYVQNDDIIKIVLLVKPLIKDKNYTVQVVLNYPSQILELKDISYGKDFIPIIGIKDYDVYDKEKGLIIKTAGMPFGFKEEKIFAVLSFKAKTSGEGSINIAQGFVLDSKDNDLLKDLENNKILVSVLTSPTINSNLFTALVLNIFKINQFLAYLILFLIFVLIYTLILFLRKYYPVFLFYFKGNKKQFQNEKNKKIEEKIKEKEINLKFDFN